MAVMITMPKLGLTMNSGSVQEWKKKVGDTVAKGEILFSVATDKLTVDVESPASGILLAITVEPGVEVPVGGPLGAIGEKGESVGEHPTGSLAVSPAKDKNAPHDLQPATAAKPTTSPRGGIDPKTGHVPASPKAKKLARERAIDINTLIGTGPKGWIVANDIPDTPAVKASPVAIKMALEAGLDLASVGTGSTGSRIMKADVAAAIVDTVTVAGAERRMPVTQMRRVIGERMLASTSSIPSVCYFLDVDMTALAEMRSRCNARLAKQKDGIKISVNDILMKLCAKRLLECPLLNASIEPDAFVMHEFVNIGFAVALPGGLMVPNIKNVQCKGLAEIAVERAELVAKTRSGTISPDALAGGTFTISNIGMMGVDSFTPIINPPEVAILGVGATKDTPVARNGEVVVRPVATLSLTADHRLVDGADAAEFFSGLKDLIEDPGLYLL